VEISFTDMALKTTCESERALRDAFGASDARVLMRRLSDLHAAGSLDDFRHLPGGCRDCLDSDGHFELAVGDRSRLVFAPSARHDGASVGWEGVTAVEVIRIVRDGAASAGEGAADV
jgi:plasmid maintenance system killer protein